MALTALTGCLSEDNLTPSSANEDAAAAYEPQLREFHLYASGLEHSPREGLTMGGMTFKLDPDAEGTVPGPEIRVREGDTVRVTLHGLHGFRHTIHWHGLSVPWEMDGVPYLTQKPVGRDETYTYEFVARETGTYWYHCHVEAPLHVDLGMFGAFIVEPADPAQDPPFDREETLFLHEADSQMFATESWITGNDQPSRDDVHEHPQDAARSLQQAIRTTLDTTGIILEAATGMDAWGQEPREYYPAYTLRYRPQYDVFMINGKSYPDTEPVHVTTGETLRLRVINAGQLVHTLHLHGHHFLVTHKDGYPLPEAARYHADTLLIGPGERYDLYVDANNPGIWDLHDHGGAWGVGGYAANEFSPPGGMNTMLVYDDFEYAQLPEPAPGEAWTSGDYAPWAPSYKGLNAPPGAVRTLPHHGAGAAWGGHDDADAPWDGGSAPGRDATGPEVVPHAS